MTTIVDSLLQFAGSQPGSPAVIHHGRTVNYGELAERMVGAAAALHREGLRAGDTAAISLDTDPAEAWRALELFYGMAFLGVAVLPLFPVVPAARRVELVRHFGASHWIGASAVPGEPAGISCINPSRLADQGVETAPPPRGDDPDRPFLYLFTSGTTGAPKAVLLTASQAFVYSRRRVVPASPRLPDRSMPAVPWPQKVGMRELLRTLVHGGTFINAAFPESCSELAEVIERFGVSRLVASPWQVRRMVQSNAGGRLLPLDALTIAGAMMSPQDIEACRRGLTPNVHLAYGSTEFGAITCLRPDDATGAGGVGRLVDGIEGGVVDESCRPLPPGSEGLLRYRADGMPGSYAGDAVATAQHFRDGWFYPGDIGSIDAAGYVTLRGRADDTINYGGAKLRPAEFGPVLERHPDVQEAVIVGVPDAAAGQLPVAFVVLRRPSTLEALYAHCAAHFDANLLPAAIYSIGRIPRSPEGKLLVDELRAAYINARSAPGAN